MKTFYYRLYYSIFAGLKRSMKEDDRTTAIMSALLFSYLLFLNCFAVLLLLKAFLKVQIPLLLLMILFPTLSCVFFLRKKKYLQIKALFENEGKKENNKRKAFCVIYMVFSFVVVMVTLYVIGNSSNR